MFKKITFYALTIILTASLMSAVSAWAEELECLDAPGPEFCPDGELVQTDMDEMGCAVWGCSNDDALDDEIDDIVDEAIEEEEEIEAEDLDVEEPGSIPSWFKGIFRDVRIFLARDPVKRSELQLEKANVILLKSRRLAEKAPDDVQLQEKLAAHDAKYQQLIETINAQLEDLPADQADDAETGKFLDKYTNHQLKHQEILQKLEDQVPEEVMDRIRENRERHLQRFGEVMHRLQDKEDLRQRLQDGLEEGAGAIRRVKRMEILEELEGVAGPEIKETIQEIKSDRQELFEEIREAREEIHLNRQEFRQEVRAAVQENREELKTNPEARQEFKQEIQEQRTGVFQENQEIRQDIRGERQDFRTDVKDRLRNLRDSILENLME